MKPPSVDELLRRLHDPGALRQARVAAVRDTRMRELLLKGEAYDVSFEPKTAKGDYILSAQTPVGVILVDAFWCCWIRSVRVTHKKKILEMANGVWRIVPEGTAIASHR